MLSRLVCINKLVGNRYFSKHLGRVITSQSAYLVSEETPLTKFFTKTPSLEEVEKKKLWINEAMEKMVSVDEAYVILKRFREGHFFVNERAINTFALNGLNMDIGKTVNALCDPSLRLLLSKETSRVVFDRLRESGNEDSCQRRLKQAISQMINEKVNEAVDNYTPYEHLRTVAENSDFYTLDYSIDINRDILGQQ